MIKEREINQYREKDEEKGREKRERERVMKRENERERETYGGWFADFSAWRRRADSSPHRSE